LTLAAQPFNGKNYTLFAFLLPYVEQQALYETMVPGSANYCGGKYMVPVAAYLCPSDVTQNGGLAETPNGGANGFAGSSYGGNYYVFGNPRAAGGDSVNVQGSNRLASLPDGTSNIVFFAEVFVTCGSSGNNGDAASLWADSTTPWRPMFCHNTAGKNTVRQTGARYANCNMFQVMPDMNNACNPGSAQSHHPLGINVCMGDGVVRFVSVGVSAQTWADACDPEDGNPVGSDF
jgi:hypothetical protein